MSRLLGLYSLGHCYHQELPLLGVTFLSSGHMVGSVTVLTLSDLKRVGDLKRNVENMIPSPTQLETSHVTLLVSPQFLWALVSPSLRKQV